MPYRNHQELDLINVEDCSFKPAPKDSTLPNGFLSTTNFPTYVKIKGGDCSNPRMVLIGL